MHIATMAYIYAAFTVCVTILELVINSNQFQMLWSYTLLLWPPVLKQVHAIAWEVLGNLQEFRLCPGRVVACLGFV